MENNQNVPGKGAAVASLVLGIIAVVLWFFGYTSIVSVILGIVVWFALVMRRRLALWAACVLPVSCCP